MARPRRLVHRAVAGQHELHHGRVDGALRDLVERLQHVHGALRLGLGAVDLELLVAVGDLHVQGFSMVRRCSSSGPHRWPRRVLFSGVKVCRRITPDISRKKGTHDRQTDRHPGRTQPTAGRGGLQRRRLRGRRAHEHVLQPAQHRREGVAAHALRGARGRADPVRLRQRGGARGVPPAHQDHRRGPAHGARAAVGHERGGAGPGHHHAGAGPAREDSRHRQEDRRAAAAGAQGQARRRHRPAPHAASATRRPTSCRRWWRWATATRKPRSR
jgi:hypothetical protein